MVEGWPGRGHNIKETGEHGHNIKETGNHGHNIKETREHGHNMKETGDRGHNIKETRDRGRGPGAEDLEMAAVEDCKTIVLYITSLAKEKRSTSWDILRLVTFNMKSKTKWRREEVL